MELWGRAFPTLPPLTPRHIYTCRWALAAHQHKRTGSTCAGAGTTGGPAASAPRSPGCSPRRLTKRVCERTHQTPPQKNRPASQNPKPPESHQPKPTNGARQAPHQARDGEHHRACQPRAQPGQEPFGPVGRGAQGRGRHEGGDAQADASCWVVGACRWREGYGVC